MRCRHCVVGDDHTCVDGAIDEDEIMVKINNIMIVDNVVYSLSVIHVTSTNKKIHLDEMISQNAITAVNEKMYIWDPFTNIYQLSPEHG